MQHFFLPLGELCPSDVQTQALPLYSEGPYSQGAVGARRNEQITCRLMILKWWLEFISSSVSQSHYLTFLLTCIKLRLLEGMWSNLPYMK